MNIFQQLAIMKVSENEVETIQFSNMEDYLRWKHEEGFE